MYKGPVKLIKQVKIAHSFFANRVRSVPHYHFKLTSVILQMAVKDEKCFIMFLTNAEK